MKTKQDPSIQTAIVFELGIISAQVFNAQELSNEPPEIVLDNTSLLCQMDRNRLRWLCQHLNSTVNLFNLVRRGTKIAADALCQRGRRCLRQTKDHQLEF